MGTEILLIIILSLLVVLLGVLYIRRSAGEKDRESVVERMDIVEFAEFLKSNSVEGNIQSVAGKVSKLLTDTFGCQRIIFLRKKRGSLELNFYHGLRKFNRQDFHIQYDDKIGKKLSQAFLPMSIDKFKPVVSKEYYERLRSYGVDMYFPIYWRNNLYGIYFIKSNLEVRTPSFTLLVASLAQSLSAAYHIKWHESKLSNLEKRLESKGENAKAVNRAKDDANGELLHLVKIRDKSKLVPQIVNRLSNDLHFNSYSLFLGGRIDDQKISSYSKGIGRNELELDRENLNNLLGMIKGRGVQSIEKLQKSNPENSQLLNELKEHHLDYITEFEVSKDNPGLLAFSGTKPSAVVKDKLKSYRQVTADLLENAEAYNRAEMMSYTDALSELSNQRYMYKRLEEEISRAGRYSRPLAFIMFDIDELKVVNDTFGHLAGDALIKQVGQTLKKSIRTIDIVARYGGDEFCIVMPESDEETCLKFMKRLRETISGTDIEIPGKSKLHNCSISMGAALFPEHAVNAHQLVHVADMAMLKAKSQGRNTYMIHGQESAEKSS